MAQRVLTICLVGMDFTVKFHFPIWLSEFLGQSASVHASTELKFPLPCSDWPASRRYESSQQVHFFRRPTGKQKFDLFGHDALPEKLVVVAPHPPLLQAVQRELLEHLLSFGWAPSVCGMGLDATAGHKRSVKIQNKREQKCSKKNHAHIKVVQKKNKRQVVVCGHSGVGIAMACVRVCRTFVVRKRVRWCSQRAGANSEVRVFSCVFCSLVSPGQQWSHACQKLVQFDAQKMDSPDRSRPTPKSRVKAKGFFAAPSPTSRSSTATFREGETCSRQDPSPARSQLTSGGSSSARDRNPFTRPLKAAQARSKRSCKLFIAR